MVQLLLAKLNHPPCARVPAMMIPATRQSDDAPRSCDLLTAWTADVLAPLEGESFDMRHGGGREEPLTLISVTTSPGLARDGGRVPFSLIFRARGRDSHLPQGCRTLQHEQLGSADVFLVPIGPDESGMRYEAVFN